jgi:hypothetical protein
MVMLASVKRMGFGVLFCAGLAFPGGVHGQLVLLDNTSNTPRGGFVVWSGQIVAQGFLTGDQAAILQKVTLSLKGSSTASGFVVSLYSDSGGSPGATLATLTGPSAPATDGNYDYTGSFALAANTKYWIVATSTGSGLVWAFTEVAGGSGPATLLSCAISGGTGSPWLLRDALWQQLRITASALSIDTSEPGFGFSGGQFGFRVAGPASPWVVVEASTNLVNWIPILTNTFSGVLTFKDPHSGDFSQRFYRARSQ